MAHATRVEHAVVPCLTLAPPIEVLLVDDQRAILAGVAALIESEGPGMQVTGQARSGREALELAHNIQPDIIVLDADLAGEEGISLIPLFQSSCHAAIVVLTCLTDPDVRHRALRLGAADFVPKTASGGELIAAILAVIEGAGVRDNCHAATGSRKPRQAVASTDAAATGPDHHEYADAARVGG